MSLLSGTQLRETAVSDNPRPPTSWSNAQSSSAVSGRDEKANVVANNGPRIVVMLIAIKSSA